MLTNFATGTKATGKPSTNQRCAFIEIFLDLWHSFFMWVRTVTAFLCLFALTTELTLDSSTSFVRSDPAPVVGKLVIVKRAVYEKKLTVPHLPGAPSDQPDSGFPDDGTGLDDLIKFGSAASHAGQVAMPVSLSVLLPVSRYIPDSDFHYREPRLSNLQKPPSV